MNYLHIETQTMKLKKFDDTNIQNPVNNARNLKDTYKIITYQSWNYLHTETQTMKLKKFDDTNIQNPVNNARNLKDITQNNNMSIMKLLAYRNNEIKEIWWYQYWKPCK